MNPLIGAAGVSAVPMAARVAQKVGQKENPQNFLLMHAMGPNVAGVIGSRCGGGHPHQHAGVNFIRMAPLRFSEGVLYFFFLPGRVRIAGQKENAESVLRVCAQIHDKAMESQKKCRAIKRKIRTNQL